MDAAGLAARANRILELLSVCPQGIPQTSLLEEVGDTDPRAAVWALNVLLRAGFAELALVRRAEWAASHLEFAHAAQHGRPAAIHLTVISEDGVSEDSIAPSDPAAASILDAEDLVVRARALPRRDQALRIEPADLT
jgi:hypothetical protein